MTKKIKKTIKYFFWALVFIIVAPIILLNNSSVQDYVKKEVQSAVKENLNVNLEFSKFTLSLVPISFNLNDVKVSPVHKPETSSNLNIRQIKLITGVHPIQIMELLFSDKKSDIVIENIRLIGINADILIRDKKALGFDKIFTAAPAAPTLKDDKKNNFSVVLNKFEIRDSDLNLLNLDDGSEVKLRGIGIYANTRNYKESIKVYTKISSIYFKYGKIEDNFVDIVFDSEYNVNSASLIISKAYIFKDRKNWLNLTGDIFAVKDESKTPAKSGFGYDLDISLRLSGGAMRGYLDKLMDTPIKLEGDYEISCDVSGKLNDFSVIGKLSSDGGNIYGVDFKALTCDVEVSKDELLVDNISAKAAGGAIEGLYYLDFRKSPDFKAKLKLKGCDIHAIEQSCPASPSLLSGAVSGLVEAVGKFHDDKTFSIDITGDLTSPKFTLYEELYPKGETKTALVFDDLRLITSLVVSDNGMEFGKTSVLTRDFDVTAHGSMPGYERYNLEFDADIRDLEAMKIPAGITETLTGSVKAKGKMSGALDNPTIVATIISNEVAYDKYSLDKGEGRVDLKDKKLTFKKFSVRKDDFDLLLDGSVDINKKVALALDIDIEYADISHVNGLLANIGEKTAPALDDLGGVCSGRVGINGNLNDLTIFFALLAPNMSVYGENGNVSIRGSAYNDSKEGSLAVDIDDVSISKGSAKIIADGKVVTGKKSYDFNYKVENVDSREILRILKKSEMDFDAKINSTGRIFGNADKLLSVSSDILLHRVSYNGKLIKNSDFKFVYGNDEITVYGNFFGGELKLDLTLSGIDFSDIGLDATFVDFQIEDYIALFDDKSDIKATLNGGVAFDTSFQADFAKEIRYYFANTTNLKAELKLSDFSTHKYKLKESTLNMNYKDHAGNLKLVTLDEKIRIDSNFEYNGDIDATSNINIHNILISDIKSYIEEESGLEGKLDIDIYFRLGDLLSIKGKKEVFANLRDINGAITLDKTRLDEFDIGKFCLNLTTAEDIVNLKGVCYDSVVKIDGYVDYKDKRDYKVTLTTNGSINYPELIRGFKIDFPKDIDGETKIKTVIAGSIDDYRDYNVDVTSELLTIKTTATASESSTPSKAASLDDNMATLETSQKKGVVFEFRNDGDIKLNFKGGDLKVESFKLIEENSSFSVTGSVNSKKIADLNIAGAINLLIIKPFLPKKIERFEGIADVKASVKGLMSDPDIFGTVALKNGTLGFYEFPYILEGIGGDLRFSEKELKIDNVKGLLNKTDIFANGSVMLNKFKPSFINISAEYNTLPLKFPKDIDSNTSARLKLEGAPDDMILSGSVDVHSLKYVEPVEVISFRDKFADLFSAEVINLKDFFPKFKKRKSEPLKYKKEKSALAFDVAIHAEKNVIIDNNIAKCEIKGDLKLIGNVTTPVITGNLEVITGRVFYFDKEFDIVSGIVNFSNESYTAPFFDTVAKREIKPEGSNDVYVVTLHLTGEMENARLYIESNPPLDKTEIFSLVMFNSDPKETEGTKGEKRKLEALKIASDMAQKQLVAQVGKFIGFDNFRIDPYYSESSDTTSARLVIGKNINDNVSVTYATDIAGTTEQSVELEYSLSKNFSLLGGWEDKGTASRGSFGGDLKFRFSFK